jgi:hypothetical protein
MFDVDGAISDWRRQLIANGVTTPEVLDELENHLREDVQTQVRMGVNIEIAFDIARERLGRGDTLQAEFKKVEGRSARLMLLACFTFVGFILWMSGYTFIYLGMNAGEQIVAYAAVVLTLVVACGWRYAVPCLPVILHKGKRMTVGWACIASGFVASNLFCHFVLAPFERNSDGLMPAIGFWAVFPIAVFACLGLGLMMSARDRQYWGMSKGDATGPADFEAGNSRG